MQVMYLITYVAMSFHPRGPVERLAGGSSPMAATAVGLISVLIASGLVWNAGMGAVVPSTPTRPRRCPCGR